MSFNQYSVALPLFPLQDLLPASEMDHLIALETSILKAAILDMQDASYSKLFCC